MATSAAFRTPKVMKENKATPPFSDKETYRTNVAAEEEYCMRMYEQGMETS